MKVQDCLFELTKKINQDNRYRDVIFGISDKLVLIDLINFCFISIKSDIKDSSQYMEVLLELHGILSYLLFTKERKLGDDLWLFVSKFDRAIHLRERKMYLVEIQSGKFEDDIKRNIVLENIRRKL